MFHNDRTTESQIEITDSDSHHSSIDDPHNRTPRKRKNKGVEDQADAAARTPRREQLGPPSLTAKNLSESSDTTERFPSPSWATQLYIKEPEWDHNSDSDDFAWDNETDNRLGGLGRSYPWNEDGRHDDLRRTRVEGSDSTIKEVFGPDPVRKIGAPNEFEVRTSVFDWSEQQPLDKGPTDTPPRPKTVHGKKDTDGRGSRSSGRRGPSGQHIRSQSVPITADPTIKRTSRANKFGTWGIGSKPVTEDWDEDFDFAELEIKADAATSVSDAPDSGGVNVFVPEAIREQQSSILANIELLREWGVLIEELKEMRSRAITLNISSENSAAVFVEVDAMINLADQEAEDQGIPHRWSVTSMPDFDADEFDTPAATPNIEDESLGEDGFGTINHDLLHQSSIALITKHSSSAVNRPRKNSEAVARSVIQALRERAVPQDEANEPSTSSPVKKVPFDTATLKHIVPYVNGLMRQVKQILRDVENLHTSPARRSIKSNSSSEKEPAEPIQGSPSSRRTLRAPRADTPQNHDEGGQQPTPQTVDDLGVRLHTMAV